MCLSGETTSTITLTIQVCVFWDKKRNQPFNKHSRWPFVWSLSCFYVNGMSDAATEGHCIALSKSSRAFVWPVEQPRCPASPVSVTCGLQETIMHSTPLSDWTLHLSTKKNFVIFSSPPTPALRMVISHICRKKMQKLQSRQLPSSAATRK